MIFYIYAIVMNDGSGVYVGATGSPYQRENTHCYELMERKHSNWRLQAAFDKCQGFEFVITKTFYPETVDDICETEEQAMRDVIEEHGRDYLLNIITTMTPDAFAVYKLPRRQPPVPSSQNKPTHY